MIARFLCRLSASGATTSASNSRPHHDGNAGMVSRPLWRSLHEGTVAPEGFTDVRDCHLRLTAISRTSEDHTGSALLKPPSGTPMSGVEISGGLQLQ